ncbi:CheR family methyltransferase [Aliikangiella coralliicola]|nr:protein-glutamate O-methyltransferase CheR [Aliikangiella coralliicola]
MDVSVGHSKKDSESIEMELLLSAISKCYGYDFSKYAQSTITRRLKRRACIEGFECVSDMISRLIYEQEFAFKVVEDFSITVTSFFRNEYFYQVMRSKVVPFLKTFPFFKVWFAGCCTGEEVYSMAIVLHEEGIYDRARLYATDINHNALASAREGIYPIKKIDSAKKAYKKSGGSSNLDKYFYCRYNSAIVSPTIARNITFAAHNLVSDGIFGEMQVIVCRNVLIYFNRELKIEVIKLLKNSLHPGGFLCIGDKESLTGMTKPEEFTLFERKAKIYKLNQSCYRQSL